MTSSPPDMTNTPVMATVYPAVTSKAVTTPALTPRPAST